MYSRPALIFFSSLSVFIIPEWPSTCLLSAVAMTLLTTCARYDLGLHETALSPDMKKREPHIEYLPYGTFLPFRVLFRVYIRVYILPTSLCYYYETVKTMNNLFMHSLHEVHYHSGNASDLYSGSSRFKFNSCYHDSVP